jgi:2-aminoadipate transaminase
MNAMTATPSSTPRLSELGQRARLPAVASLMAKAIETPGLLSVAAGMTDAATMPVQEFADAAQALAERSGEPDFMNYGTTQGRAGLRKILADRLRYWEPTLADPGIERSILVTTGSQQALYIAVQSLCNPGDIVLVDRPTYFAFLDVATSLGARPVSLPYDADGRLEVPQLDELLTSLRRTGELERVKAVYLVTYFSNPSGRCLCEDDKRALATVLERHGVIVPLLEDVAYRELYFDEPFPARSALTLPEWQAFPRLYCATLTKPFSTGGKIGWSYCTDAKWQAQLLAIKGTHDFGSSNYMQALFEIFLGRGAFETHVPKVRRGYKAKMEALHAGLLEGGLRELGWNWEVPTGGMYLWLRAPAGFDTSMESAFCATCLKSGVLYVPGDLCFGDRAAKNWIRASFGVLPPEQLREAGRRLAAAAHRFAP